MSLTFPVHFMHLSYIQYRSYNQEHFLVCRKCHMFCTFSVPIVCSTGHTTRNISWYICRKCHMFCIFSVPNLCSTGHITRNISWYAENVTFSVHFLYQSYAVQVIQPGTFLMCRKCQMFCTFSVPILYSTSFDQEHFLMCRNCNMFCAFSLGFSEYQLRIHACSVHARLYTTTWLHYFLMYLYIQKFCMIHRYR